MTVLPFVNFEKLPNGNLRITLTDSGREVVEEMRDNPERYGEELAAERATFDLFEHHICNGWAWIPPEKCGAITDALIITDDVEYSDDGEITHLGRVYSNIDYYQIEGDIPRLLRKGELIWRGVE